MSHLGTTWLVTWQTSSTFLSFPHLHSICLYRRYWRIPNFSGFRIFRRFGWLGEYSYSLPPYFLFQYFASWFHTLFCISFIALYYAWPTLRGRWTLDYFYVYTCHTTTSDLLVTCYLLTHVYHLINWHVTLWLDPIGMTWLTQTITYIYCHAWLLIHYHHPIMLSPYTQHDNLTCDYLLYGDLTYYHISWSVTCIPALYAVTWLYVLVYSRFLIMSVSCYSRKVIIKLLNLKMDQLVLGRGKHADIDMCSCLQWL